MTVHSRGVKPSLSQDSEALTKAPPVPKYLSACLRRHGVSNLRDLKEKAPKPTHKPFKAYEPGFMHIDVKYLPQMADETRHGYLFVAIHCPAVH